MPNQYDRIYREVFEEIFVPMLKRCFDMDLDKVSELPGKLEQTLEREPDFLKLVDDGVNGKFILHIEYQTRDDPHMVYRMQTYHAMLMQKFRLPIRQMVFRFGPQPSAMRDRLEDWEVMRGFELVDISRMDFRFFLGSDQVGEMAFAMLADFGETPREQAVGEILKRVFELEGDSQKGQKVIQQLLIISRIDNLVEVMETTLKKMPFTIDVTRDILFNRGLAKGMTEGEAKAKNAMARNLLRQDALTLEQIAQVTDLSIQDVLDIRAEMDR